MTLTRHTQGGRLAVGTTPTVLPVDNWSPIYGVSVRGKANTGLPYPTGRMVDGMQQAVGCRVTVPFSQAYDALGLGLNAYSQAANQTCACYLAELEGAQVKSGASHDKYDMATSGYATAYIDAVRGRDGGELLAEVVVLYWSPDGTTDPMPRTASQSLPALSAVRVDHGMGPASLDGAKDGVMGIEYQSGCQINVKRPGDGLPYAIGGTLAGFEQRMNISLLSISAVIAALGSRGEKISAATIDANKWDNDILSATGKRTFSMSDVYAHIEGGNGPHGEEAECQVVLSPSSADGTTSAVTVT